MCFYPLRLVRRHWIIIYIISLALTIGLNLCLSLVRGEVVTRFARDNSLLTLLQAVAVFQLFAGMHCFWPIINWFAGFVFPAYIYNTIILSYYLPTLSEEVLNGHSLPGTLGILIFTVVLTLIISIPLELVRRLLAFPFVKWVFPQIDMIANRVGTFWEKIFFKLLQNKEN